jgi:cystathionine beta-synthase
VVAEKLAASTPGSVFLNQRHNPANAAAYATLAAELVEQLPQMDTLVGTIGTAGTLCGTAKALKHAGKHVHVLAVEPVGSTYFSESGGPYYIQGAGRPLGASLPKNFNPELIDSGVQVSDKAAFATCGFLADRLGLLVGGSSGAALYAAAKYASAHPDRTVAVIMPDAGEKYVSTIFSKQWRDDRSLHDHETENFLTSITRTNHGPA